MPKYILGVGYVREQEEWMATDVMPADATEAVKEWLMDENCDEAFSYVVELELPEVPKKVSAIKTIAVDLTNAKGVANAQQ